jgi:hypothetical protein
MKFTRLFLAIAAFSFLASADDSPGEAKAAPGNTESMRLPAAPLHPLLPPVLRPLEPPDSHVVQLPGAPVPAVTQRVTPRLTPRSAPVPAPVAAAIPAPVAAAVPAPVAAAIPAPVAAAIPAPVAAAIPTPVAAAVPAPVAAAIPAPAPVPVATIPKRQPIPFRYVAARSNPVSLPALPPAPAIPTPAVKFETPAILEPPKKTYPADFTRDSALFCQKRIGEWTTAEAQALLGDAIRQRPALDDDKTESGRIYAFTDPSDRYKELELDFAKDTGLLRTVFVYPHNLSWTECRRLWGANVSAAEVNKGRKFYSYLNRRLDVLVDSSGKVISLGLY